MAALPDGALADAEACARTDPVRARVVPNPDTGPHAARFIARRVLENDSLGARLWNELCCLVARLHGRGHHEKAALMSRCAQRGRHRHLRCADCGAMVTTVANLIKHFMQACPAGPGQAVPEQGAEQEGAEPPPPNEPGIPIDPGTLMDVDPPFNAGNVPFPFLQQLLPVGAAQHQMPQAPLPAEPLFDFTWALINQIPGPVGVLPTAWHLPAAPLLEAGAVQGEPVDPVLFPQPGTPHPADFADGDEDEDAGDWILSSGLMQGLGQLDLEGDDVSNLSCSFDFGALSDRLGIDIDPVGLPALGLPDYSVLMQ